MGRTLVVCYDGTGNEYRTTNATNVVRLYRALDETAGPDQIAFYDPGLGTFSDEGAITGIGRKLTLLAGLAFGYGIKQNLSDGYRFLMDNYRDGDRVLLFGFSRGAYTARALAGMLRHVGLLHAQHDNLVDYAIKIFWKRKPDWHLANSFRKRFSRKIDVDYLGVFDTVKSIGWLRRRLVLPWTAELPNVKAGRHAVAIDEQRSQFRPNLWHPEEGDFRQVWFAGVHSDVGGTFEDDPRLADITLNWILAGAREHGLMVDLDEVTEPTDDAHLGVTHPNLWPFWWIVGWYRRKIPDGALVHATVERRLKESSYRPQLPDNVAFVD